MTRSAITLTMVLTTATVGAVASDRACAQNVSVELRGGAAIGNYSESGAGLEWAPEPSFAAEAQLGVRPDLSLYGGFTRSTFGCDEGFCTGLDATLTAQGITVGGRWTPGLPWVRAGLAWQSLDLDATSGGASGGMGFGFDVGAGVDLGLGRLFRLRPGLSYRRVGSSLDGEDGHFALLALELGVAVRIFSADAMSR